MQFPTNNGHRKLFGPVGSMPAPVLGVPVAVDPYQGYEAHAEPRVAQSYAFPPRVIFAFLVLLNMVAIYGQAAWFRGSITNHNGPEDWVIPIGVALVIEAVGVFLAGMAHASLMADQSAGLLRTGSYAIGGLVGVLNYWHFSGPEFQPNATAITFGAISTVSPWLWAIYSRYLNRDRLTELGLVDTRGVKLSTSRKFWHPWRSLAVMSWAAWAGVTSPTDAVAGWEAERAAREEAARDAEEDTQQAPDTGPDTADEGAEASEDSAGQTSGRVQLDAGQAARTARALRASDPDMPLDEIAQIVGRSTKQVDRYLKAPETQ